MSGRFWRVIGSSVSRHAARIGSAAFLLPPGRMVPSRRRPPSTMKRSIGMRRRLYFGVGYTAVNRADEIRSAGGCRDRMVADDSAMEHLAQEVAVAAAPRRRLDGGSRPCRDLRSCGPSVDP